LYHWDLPQALQGCVGGWQSSDTSKAFATMTGYVAERLAIAQDDFLRSTKPAASSISDMAGHPSARLKCQPPD